MPPLFPLFQLVLLMFAGWVNRHQLDVIEYLQEENRVLKERLGGRGLSGPNCSFRVIIAGIQFWLNPRTQNGPAQSHPQGEPGQRVASSFQMSDFA